MLGPADITDQQLTAMVAASLDATEVELLTSHVEVFPYDLPAIGTTGGRYLVSGTARADGARVQPYVFFVKVVQSWARSPLSRHVPEELRAVPARWSPGAPSRISTAPICATRLRLPAGLTAPRAFAVYDLDDEIGGHLARTGGHPHHRLGRRTPRACGLPTRTPRRQCISRPAWPPRPSRCEPRAALHRHVAPAQRAASDCVANSCGGNRWSPTRSTTTCGPGVLAAADALPALLDELDDMPITAAHGDACTRNLLVTDADDGFTLIDFGFWGEAPIGFDLGQLLLGEIQMGERPAHTLPQLEDACLPAYVQGLRAEGSQATIAQVRRSHAILNDDLPRALRDPVRAPGRSSDGRTAPRLPSTRSLRPLHPRPAGPHIPPRWHRSCS